MTNRIISIFENSCKKYNQRNEFDFRTALHRAAYWGQMDVTKVLVDHGGNLEAKNNRGL